MVLLLDASSPAIVYNGGGATVVSGSFTPPAGALLHVSWSGNSGTGNTPAAPIISNTGGALTWALVQNSTRADATPLADGQATMWWAVATGVAMTVSVANQDPATGGAIKVMVWTDDSGGTPSIGANKENSAQSGTAISDSVTALSTGSRGVMVYTDWTGNAGVATAGTGCTLTGGGAANQGSMAYAFLLRTTADSTAGAAITMNLNSINSNHKRWVIAEVRPAATTASTPRRRRRGPNYRR